MKTFWMMTSWSATKAFTRMTRAPSIKKESNLKNTMRRTKKQRMKTKMSLIRDRQSARKKKSEKKMTLRKKD